MNRLAIEINGAGLLIADSSSVLANEPGYALVDDGRTITGSAAYRQARLQPSRARSGFWSRLSVSGGAAESDAELAYEHLRMVWEQVGASDSRAILVVPGSYSAEQLGLVLGIAQECGIAVEAMIDSAVAASELHYEGAQLLYLDASLRTVTAARLDQSGGAATVDTREISDATGLADFTDEMARTIARLFVLETRVDPLHHAESEQQLYNGLPGWLQALHRDGTAIAEITYAGEPVTVELTVENMRSASLRLFREIARLIAELRTPAAPAVVQLNHRLARLPGLRTELQRIDGITLVELPQGFPATSVLRRTQDSNDASQEVQLLRRLPFSGVGEVAVATNAQQEAERDDAVTPTHVIFEGIGYRLAAGGLEVRDATRTTSVNGQRVVAIGNRGGGDDAHCILRFNDRQLAVQRVGATKVSVNDEQVDSSRSLEVGDIIRVGDPAAEMQIVALEE